MGKGQNFFQQLANQASLSAGAMPARPIVELSGDRRVLIEHHFGVKEYGRTRITVKMSYGQVSIQGECLEILRMTKEQLVICGRIDEIQLQRRVGRCADF